MELIQDHNIYTRRPIDQVKIKEDSNAPVGLRLIQVNSFPFRTKNDWIARKGVKNIRCMDPWVGFRQDHVNLHPVYPLFKAKTCNNHLLKKVHFNQQLQQDCDPHIISSHIRGDSA